MIPRTFLSTYAANGQQQMAVKFLTDVTGLQRWADYIPVKLTQGGSENTYANNGFIDVVSVTVTSTMRPFAEYVPVYVDSSATDAWQVNATGYIPYGYAGFGDANMVLDFTNGSSLDSRITFTRASTATRTNPSGIIESVAINTPRFDYNPVTLAPLGLLIEEQRTNLLTYSEQFDDAAWNKTLGTVTVTVTADSTTSPDGTVDADKVITANATGDHVIAQVASVTSGTTYTQSWFLKAAELNWVQVTESTGFGSTQFQNINLSNGAVGNGNYGSAVSVTSFGNGWYRVSVTDTATATSASGRFLLALLTSDVAARLTDITGNGTSGIYIWGAQLEAGAFATSYIPTVASQVTRSADLASMTGTNFSSWFNATEGTVVSNITLRNTPALATQSLYAISNGTISERILVATGTGSGGNINSAVSTGGVLQAQTINGSLSNAGNYKYANTYKINDFASIVNGGSAVVDTSGNVPTVDRLFLGANHAGNTSFLNGTISRIAYYPTRLTNAQLQSLSS